MLNIITISEMESPTRVAPIIMPCLKGDISYRHSKCSHWLTKCQNKTDIGVSISLTSTYGGATYQPSSDLGASVNVDWSIDWFDLCQCSLWRQILNCSKIQLWWQYVFPYVDSWTSDSIKDYLLSDWTELDYCSQYHSSLEF